MRDNFVSTIIICSLSVFMLLSLNGCFSNNKQVAHGTCTCKEINNVDNTAYKFASEVSMEDPNIFEHKAGYRKISYYDKSLKMDSWGWFPVEGSGREICVREDGSVSIIYWNAADLKKVSEGQIMPNQMEGTAFCYDPNFDGEEAITMAYNGSLIVYFKTGLKWERCCFDTSKFTNDIEDSEKDTEEYSSFKEIFTLSRKQIDEKKIKKYLDLIEKVRLKYHDGTK